jgi:pimeloyl-ACP methyl ester carboxylesterase
MAYALRNPNQARGLVLIDPFYNPDQLQPLMRFLCWRPTIGERLLQLTPLWLLELAAQMDLTDALPYASQSMRRIALDYKRASTKVLYIPASLPDLTNKLGEINIPTLVIWGEKDLTLLPDSFPRLVRAMPGASGSVIRNSGHQPHISRPDEVLRLTLEFIAKL